jgi:hypothetical protein
MVLSIVFEGEWKWVVDDEPLAYINWKSGQPDNLGGRQNTLGKGVGRGGMDHVPLQDISFAKRRSILTYQKQNTVAGGPAALMLPLRSGKYNVNGSHKSKL